MHDIETEKITKEFDGLVAVDHVNLKVKRGELFGLLGPNGAGKTTLIRMLSTLLRPTSGRAEVAGHSVMKEMAEVRENIGMVFQDPSLDIELTGRENLDFHMQMYADIGRAERERRIGEVLKLVGLQEKADVRVKYYSGGMQRRLEIARGLMHQPRVLFLDEPTLGLDAQTRRKIWEHIRELNRRREVTIILTTHYMEEADYLCDRVAVMNRGRIIATDEPEKLKDSIGGDVISLEIAGNFRRRLKETFSSYHWVEEVSEHGEKLELKVSNGKKLIPRIVNIATEQEAEISSLSLRQPTLG